MIETERLLLRRWLPRDRAAFAAINADPDVMTYFPRCLDRTESDALLGRLQDRWQADGIGFAAAERRSDGAFAGMIGIGRVHFEAGHPLDGALEIGWRLPRGFWGQGYATEAARGWLGYGFRTLGATEIVAFSVPPNHRSHAVMHRLGMREDPARRFEHPLLPRGHPLRPHLLHALGREAWKRGQG